MEEKHCQASSSWLNLQLNISVVRRREKGSETDREKEIGRERRREGEREGERRERRREGKRAREPVLLCPSVQSLRTQCALENMLVLLQFKTKN